MIKCNVTVCGVIGRDASTRTGKEDKKFLSFPLRVAIQGKDGQSGTVEISVSKDGNEDEAVGYRNGSRVEVTGTMYLKRRGDKLYFNLFADRIGTASLDDADSLKGEMSFRGKVGKNIEQRKEKVDDGFEYQWVRFFCFNGPCEEWLQPGVKVDAKGEMAVSLHNGKPDISCRVEELSQYVASQDNSNL